MEQKRWGRVYLWIVMCVGTIASLPGAAATAQTPGTEASGSRFEVASVKPSAPGQAPLAPGGVRPEPGGLNIPGATLKQLMCIAYGIKPEQITGGPEWTGSALFDINAKAERPSSYQELRAMLRNLLADRFALRTSSQTKNLPIYMLAIDQGGPKLSRSDSAEASEPWIDQTIQQVVKVTWRATSVPMSYFTWRLSQGLDRPVVDHTKLEGAYSFELKYTRDLPAGMHEGALLNGVPIDTSGPTIFAAVRRQLGLRLDAERGPADVLAIESVERPSVN